MFKPRRTIKLLPIVLLFAVPAGFLLVTQDNQVKLFYAGVFGLIFVLVAGLGIYGKVISYTIAGFILAQPYLLSLLASPIVVLTPNYVGEISNSSLAGLASNARITTDRFGFRSTADNDKEFSSDTIDELIVLIGASTIEQAHNGDEATTGYLLAEHFATQGVTSKKVVNTGVSGLRTRQHIDHLRFFNSAYADEISTTYFILVGVNDWNHAVTQIHDGKAIAQDPPTILEKNEQFIKNAFRIVPALFKRGRTAAAVEDPMTFLSNYVGTYPEKPKFDIDSGQIAAALDWNARQVRMMIEQCEAHRETVCIFSTQPTAYREENFADAAFLESLWMTPAKVDWALDSDDLQALSQAFNRQLVDLVGHSGCQQCAVIDADAVLDGNLAYFYDDVHFTDAGARRMAELFIDAHAKIVEPLRQQVGASAGQ